MGQSPLCNSVDIGEDNTEISPVKQRSALGGAQRSDVAPSAFGALCAGETARCGWLCGTDPNGLGLCANHVLEPSSTAVTTERGVVVQECCVRSARFDHQGVFPGDADVDAAQIVHSTGAIGNDSVFGNGHVLAFARDGLSMPHIRFNFNDLYELGQKIGEGSFGDVYEAVARALDPVTGMPLPQPSSAAGLGPEADEEEAQPQEPSVGHSAAPPEAATDDPMGSAGYAATAPGRKVAVKVFSLKAGSERETRERRSFEAERSMLATLEHPNLVKMIECFEDKERNKLYIVLELCQGGELYARMIRTSQEGRAGEDEASARMLFRQMLRAVGYLHSQSVTHRDLKTENFLLLGKPGSPQADVLKLCDFGAAVRLRAGQRSMEKTGTLSYTAPEVYMNKGACAASDSWALGVVLYVILTGTNPFRMPDHSREDTVRCIQLGQFDQKRASWCRTSEAAKDLIRHLLVLDESRRLTPKEALQHAWLLADQPSARLPPPSAGQVGGEPAPGSRFAILAEHAPKALLVLRKFERLDPLQKLALAVLARVVDELPIIHSVRPGGVEWYNLYVVLDEDQDGALCCGEFVQGFLAGSQGARPDDLRILWTALDADGSGYVDWAEWLMLALLDAEGATEAPGLLGTVFRLLDRSSSDGVVTVADVMSVVGTTLSTPRHGTAIVGHGVNSAPAASRTLASRALAAWVFKATRPAQKQELDLSIAQENGVMCSYCEEQWATKACHQCASFLCEECVVTSHSHGYFKTHLLQSLRNVSVQPYMLKAPNSTVQQVKVLAGDEATRTTAELSEEASNTSVGNDGSGDPHLRLSDLCRAVRAAVSMKRD